MLMATDREIGTGMSGMQPMLGFGTGPGSNAQGNPLPDGGGCAIAGELCWTKFDVSFKTTRAAFAGEHLTFQIALLGVREFAFGHEGLHASKVTVVAAPMPASGLDFGTTIDSPANGSRVTSGTEIVAGGRVSFPDLGSDPTGAGDHPTQRAVEVSIDDAGFTSPRQAAWDAESGTWSLALGSLANGQHTIYARARMDTTYSAVASAAFTVAPDARVEWQVVRKNGAPSATGWQDGERRLELELPARDRLVRQRQLDDRRSARRGRPRGGALDRGREAEVAARLRGRAPGPGRQPEFPASTPGQDQGPASACVGRGGARIRRGFHVVWPRAHERGPGLPALTARLSISQPLATRRRDGQGRSLSRPDR